MTEPNFEGITDEQLSEELARRVMARPKLPPRIEVLNFNKVRGMVERWVIANCRGDLELMKNIHTGIFSSVIETVYGDEIWTWIDEQKSKNKEG